MLEPDVTIQATSRPPPKQGPGRTYYSNVHAGPCSNIVKEALNLGQRGPRNTRLYADIFDSPLPCGIGQVPRRRPLPLKENLDMPDRLGVQLVSV